MNNLPLHPVVVHFPIVFSTLLPLLIAVFGGLIFTKRISPRWWAMVLAFQLALSLSTYIALETGENEEDTVERFVSEQSLEEHEHLAKRFFILTLVGSGLALAGMATSLLGSAAGLAPIAYALTLLLSLLTLGAGIATGHAGGKLVYQENAGAAYQSTAVRPFSPPASDDHDND